MSKVNQHDIIEMLYKMYNAQDKTEYTGSTAKFECDIKGEHGIFKERISMQSKDHIMEQVVYELALLMGVKCCKASCRKVQNYYGAFSRFEIPDGCKLVHAEQVFGQVELFIDDLLNKSLLLVNGNVNNFVIQLYQYLIFDYVVGQHDRHLENLALIKKDNKYSWYPLYDNGICCFSIFGNDAAIESLSKGFYSSRVGSSSEILETLYKYRDIIYKDNLLNILQYSKVNKEVIISIINKADKYNQMSNKRREVTANFIMRQIGDIDSLNYRRL